MADTAAWLVGGWEIVPGDDDGDGHTASMRFRTLVLEAQTAATYAASVLEQRGFDVLLMKLDDGELRVLLEGQNRPSDSRP